MKYLKQFESWNEPLKKEIKLIGNGYTFDNLNKEGFFQGQKTIKKYTETPDWEPLYKFLEPIFGEHYLDAANGFMWYGKYDTLYKNQKGEPIIYDQYRHGITRKWLSICEDGTPIEIDFSFSNFYMSHYIERIWELTSKKAFKDVYFDLDKYLKIYGDEIPKELYFVKYSDFKQIRDEFLKKAGYDVITTTAPEDFKNLKNEKQGNYSKVANNLKSLQYTNTGNDSPRKKELDGELISDEELDNLEIPYDLSYTGHIKTPQYNLRLRKKGKEPKIKNI